MRNRQHEDGGSGWASETPGRISPREVQEKRFGVSRISGGYRMRDVDEFLDQVSDTLSALLAENERLRTGGPAVPAATPAVADESDRAAIDAFLRREKGFLQSLGVLVQEHAEELREMIRAARRPAAPAPDAEQRGAVAATAGLGAMHEAAPPARAHATPEPPDEEDGEEDVPAAAIPAAAATAVEGDAAPPRETPVVVGEDASQEGSDDEAVAEIADEGDRDTGTVATVGSAEEEPIRLEEPQPARSRRSKDDPRDEGSLRDLFWGEE